MKTKLEFYNLFEKMLSEKREDNYLSCLIYQMKNI
jgi:hypothetical protein